MSAVCCISDIWEQVLLEYALSEPGESMRPILDAMEIWGTNYKKTAGKELSLPPLS